MPAVSTEKLLVILEQSGLLDREVLDDIRSRVSKARGRIDPRSVTKWLVQKKYLTVEQGLEFLDGRIPPSATSQPAPKRDVESDLVLADDLEVLQDEDLEVVDDEDLEVVDDDLEVVDDDLEVVDESDLVEAPAAPKPSARPAGKPARPEAKPKSEAKAAKPAAKASSVAAKPKAARAAPVVDDLSALDAPLGGNLDPLAVGGALSDTAALTAGRTVAATRFSKPKKGKQGNVWDSNLLLIGGGTLLALIILAVGLWWAIFRTTGDQALKLAEDDYDNGSYTQAVHKYDRFLESFPKHKGASLARVHRGLAIMRQVTEGTSDWTRALDSSQQTLDEIATENEFGQARAELAALLPKIAEGLAEQARKKPDQKVVDRAGEALALVEKYVPKSQRPGEQLQAVEQSLALTKLQLSRGTALDKALEDIKAALEANEPARAYEVRRTLLRIHPDLEPDSKLVEAILAVSQAERKNVEMVQETQKGISDEAASSIVSTTTLVSHRDGAVPGVGSRMVFALADGSAYALEAGTGHVKWRRHVGYDTHMVPRQLTGAAAANALLIDSVHKDLLCVDAASGKLKWRQALGDVSDAEPFSLRNRLAIATRNGRLLLIEADSGNLAGYVKFPHPLTVAPAVESRERHLYQVADDSNLYVISLPDGRCEEVVYVGHTSGTIRVPPLCVSRYVILAENQGARDSTLRVYVANDDGVALKLAQSVPMEGHVQVPPQLSGGKTLILCTDRGAFYAFDIGGVEKKEPLTRLAARPATDSKSTLRFCLARGSDLWVADQKLDKYDILAARGQIGIKWTENVDDVFLQPLEEAGDALIHVRRKHGLPGIAVAAAKKSDGKLLWETHLAAPLAADPALDAAQNTLLSMNLVGSPFQVRADQSSSILEAPLPDERAIRPVGAGNGGATLPNGSQACLLGRGSPNIWIVDRGDRPQTRDLRLPFAAAAAPAALAGNLLVPTLAGQVVVQDLQGGTPVEPFQPKLAAGVQVAWLRPCVTPDGNVLIADGADRMYRLVVETQPRPHLEPKATAELISPITTSIAVAGQTVFAGDVNGRLTSYALATLSPGNDWSLGAPMAWGPVAVGDNVLVSTRGNELYCFDGQPAQRWHVPLSYGPLAGDPVLIDGKLVLVSTRGVIWSVNPADGLETNRVELNQPLGSAAIPVGSNLVVAGSDGVLHKIAKP